MTRCVLLMYHSLFADAREYQAIDAADRPYAVAADRFTEQLEAIRGAGLNVIDPGQLETAAATEAGGVVLTFDDGHASNHHHALPILRRLGMKAIFFVTSDFIERRRGFCTWAQVREMAEHGMTIGSHGRSHRFLDDLSDTEAIAELADSKSAIESGINRRIDQVSFPGGRFRPHQLALWRPLGYRVFHSSRVGVAPGQPVQDGVILPRLAIRRDSGLPEVLTMARADRTWLLRAAAVASTKQLLRRVAGNRLYHRLYERLYPENRG
ncbi:MAG: polysaccharide deacetylase family protein [Burkholderiaceae bacterium]